MTEQAESMTAGERTDLLFGASNWDLGQEGEILSSDFDDDLFGESTFHVAGMGNPFNVRQSPDPFNPDSLDDKQVVQAAAAAAGLSRGGLRRAAFSMNDMTALVPSNSSPVAPTRQRKGVGSPSLPKVSEGEELHQARRPVQSSSMGGGGGMGMSSHSSQSSGGTALLDGGGGGKGADRLNGMSINELEEELVRSRNQMASYQVPMTSEAGGTRIGGGSADMYGLPGGLEDGATWNDNSSSTGAAVPRGFRSGGGGFMGGMEDGSGDSPLVGGSKSRMRRAQSTGDLAGMGGPTSTGGSGGSLSPQRGVGDRLDLEFSIGEATTSSSVYRIGKYTLEERRNKILRYRQKRHERNFNKKIKYACRKTLADSRPRIRGRFAKNEEWDAMKAAAARREEQGLKSDEEEGLGGGISATMVM